MQHRMTLASVSSLQAGRRLSLLRIKPHRSTFQSELHARLRMCLLSCLKAHTFNLLLRSLLRVLFTFPSQHLFHYQSKQYGIWPRTQWPGRLYIRMQVTCAALVIQHCLIRRAQSSLVLHTATDMQMICLFLGPWKYSSAVTVAC